MGYYYIELYPGSKEIFTIVLMWGKYEHQKLPIGVCNRPNTFQGSIFDLFESLDMVRAYIYNVVVITKNDFVDHLKSLKHYYRNLRK